jgi:hypothetical protein
VEAGPDRNTNESREITVYEVLPPDKPQGRGTTLQAPKIVTSAGKAAEFAWEEFFQGELANPHTRKNYIHAVKKFLAWAERERLKIPDIAPGWV